MIIVIVYNVCSICKCTTKTLLRCFGISIAFNSSKWYGLWLKFEKRSINFKPFPLFKFQYSFNILFQNWDWFSDIWFDSDSYVWEWPFTWAPQLATNPKSTPWTFGSPPPPGPPGTHQPDKVDVPEFLEIGL